MGTGPSRRAELAGRRGGVRVQARRRRRRAGIVGLAVMLLLGVVFGGGAYVLGYLRSTPDFDAAGTGDVVVRVHDGDSTTQIGAMLAQRGVVASAAAFTHAAAADERVRGIQPGYYQLRSMMSGASAVALLLDPASRVGRLEIRGGAQLDDTRSPDGTVVPGVLSLISQASCARFDGQRRCVSADALRTTMTGTDPAELGVPGWALDDVRRAEPARRLEGLFVPGVYDVAPGTPAAGVLRSVLAVSLARLEATGIAGSAKEAGLAPYQVLTVASLVEKEAITPDMPEVARVIYNRLGADQRLELDSTVNYPLDLQALRTTAEARAKAGAYNTYAVTGLPPTPIAAPGRAAIAAARNPEPGPWLYFVRCKPDGSSCFGRTLEEHKQNVRTAIANGAI